MTLRHSTLWCNPGGHPWPNRVPRETLEPSLLKSVWCLQTLGAWTSSLSLGEIGLAYCHFHCIKDQFGYTETGRLIDMDTVNSSGMEPENVGHLVNSNRAARTALSINLPCRRPELWSQWLCKRRQAQRLKKQLPVLSDCPPEYQEILVAVWKQYAQPKTHASELDIPSSQSLK